MSKEQPEVHGREVNITQKQNIWGLMSHDKRNRFYSLASGSHGEGFEQGRTCVICAFGVHFICYMEIELLAGGEVVETTEELGLASRQGIVMPGSLWAMV